MIVSTLLFSITLNNLCCLKVSYCVIFGIFKMLALRITNRRVSYKLKILISLYDKRINDIGSKFVFFLVSLQS